MPVPRRLRRLRHARCWVPRDLRAITDVGEEEEPAAGGLRRDDVDAIWAQTEKLYRHGLSPLITLCIRRHGRVVLHRSLGFSHGGGPEAPPGMAGRTVATTKTPVCIFSASKAITAMVIHLLDEKGLLHIDDHVVEYWPEFGGLRGKDRVTLRHVLTHRAGFPSAGEREDVATLTDWPAMVRQLEEGELQSRPGRRLSYHALTGGWVLGEVVRRVTGKDIRQVLREEFLDPLGIDRLHYGVPPEDVPLVATSHFTGVPPFPPMSHLARFMLGMDFERAVELSNSAEYLTSIVPSGNIVGTADELSRFFQMLLDGGELDGVRVLEPRTINRARQRTTFREIDASFLVPVAYGLGFMLGGGPLSPFGADAAGAFGHLGLINIHCWADPARDTSVALITTGKPLASDHLLDHVRLLNLINRRCPKGGRR